MRWEDLYRFNATTAFLLPREGWTLFHDFPAFQCHHGVPASPFAEQAPAALQPVSMPPWRSCFRDPHRLPPFKKQGFNATTAFLLQAGSGGERGPEALFQCHHGVPASLHDLVLRQPQLRFNATTAFLLRFMTDAYLFTRTGFNATTAFLLPPTRGSAAAPAWPVSMPPRRSCFLTESDTAAVLEASFNATTAFLLRDRVQLFRRAHHRFQCHHGVPASGRWRPASGPRRPGFNATTAFLLHSHQRRTGEVYSGFNATTAFLLRIGPSTAGISNSAFQCHHGVPASSVSGSDLASYDLVSMPPRRSCFHDLPRLRLPGQEGFNATTAFLLLVAEFADVVSEFSFNATTAFLLPSSHTS